MTQQNNVRVFGLQCPAECAGAVALHAKCKVCALSIGFLPCSCALATAFALIMDDFLCDDGQSSTAPPESSSASLKSSSTAGSSAADKRKVKLCGFPGCDLDCKSGRRHCSHHNRHLDNSRNQVAKKYGPEGLKAFSDMCRDIEFANSQIEYMAKKSIGLAMFARAPLIDFVEWEQKFGVLIEKKEAVQTRPFEERQWVLRQVRKFGRDEKQMTEEWKRKIAGPYKRDYDGYQGAFRLWLPALEFEENSKKQFVQGSSVEKSKQKKTPQDWEMDAFRAHALEAGLDHSNPFFGGLSSMNVDKEDAVEPGPEEAADAQVKQVSPTKKRKAETLDASEDETEVKGSSSKKPRKSGNLSAARAACFEMASKQYVAKVAGLTARLDEAKKAVDAEAASVAPTSPTDITTRKLYKDALDSVLEVATAWMDPSTLSSKVAAHNAKDEVKASQDQQVDTKQAESLSQQSPSLTWLLSKANGAALRMERVAFLRTKDLMQKFVDDIPAGELDEAKLDKQRVMWVLQAFLLSL